MTKDIPEVTPSEGIVPTHVPWKCPVCYGWGSFSKGKTPCKSCKGKGFILVKAVVKKEDL